MNRASVAACERWSRIIEEQRSSGLSVARFCAERRIPASSFFPWRKRLRGATRPAPAFVEAMVRGVEPEGRGVAVEVAGGRRVMVGRGFDHELLLEVIDALESGREAKA